MWIISVDIGYYPYILKFNSKEEAVREYILKRKNVDFDEAMFLSEVIDTTLGENYEIEFEDQLK